MTTRPGRGGSRRRTLVAVVIVALAAVLGVAVYRAAQSSGSSSGANAPAFRLAAIDGRTVSLSSVRGRTVVLGFVQPDCSTCIGTLRTLAQVASRVSASRVAVLAVDVNDATSARDLAVFAHQIGATPGPQFVLDRGDQTARAYGVQTLETEVVIDPSGRIVTRGVALPASALVKAVRSAQL